MTAPIANTKPVASAIGYQKVSLFSLAVSDISLEVSDITLEVSDITLEVSAINLAISASAFLPSVSVISYSFLLIKKKRGSSPWEKSIPMG
jgi:hypothetical protein